MICEGIYMEEFYLLSLNLTYTEEGLNQKWTNSLLDEICEKDNVLVGRANAEPLEMRLAKKGLGICARSNSPDLRLYVYGKPKDIAEVIKKLSHAVIDTARSVKIPILSANDLKQYFSFSKVILNTNDPLIAGLWKVDSERKKSLYF